MADFLGLWQQHKRISILKLKRIGGYKYLMLRLKVSNYLYAPNFNIVLMGRPYTRQGKVLWQGVKDLALV